MTGAHEPREPWPQDWRIGVSVGVLALAFIAIGYLIGWGDDGNDLHRTTLSWSFTLVAGILVINGITAWVAPPTTLRNLTTKGD